MMDALSAAVAVAVFDKVKLGVTVLIETPPNDDDKRVPLVPSRLKVA